MQFDGQLIEINRYLAYIFLSYIFISLIIASCDSPLVSTFYVLITGCARSFTVKQK